MYIIWRFLELVFLQLFVYTGLVWELDLIASVNLSAAIKSNFENVLFLLNNLDCHREVLFCIFLSIVSTSCKGVSLKSFLSSSWEREKKLFFFVNQQQSEAKTLRQIFLLSFYPLLHKNCLQSLKVDTSMGELWNIIFRYTLNFQTVNFEIFLPYSWCFYQRNIIEAGERKTKCQ